MTTHVQAGGSGGRRVAGVFRRGRTAAPGHASPCCDRTPPTRAGSRCPSYAAGYERAKRQFRLVARTAARTDARAARTDERSRRHDGRACAPSGRRGCTRGEAGRCAPPCIIKHRAAHRGRMGPGGRTVVRAEFNQHSNRGGSGPGRKLRPAAEQACGARRRRAHRLSGCGACGGGCIQENSGIHTLSAAATAAARNITRALQERGQTRSPVGGDAVAGRAALPRG